MAEQDLVVTPQVVIPEAELSWRFSRSSGAGGQNVNKVNSRAELLWTPATSQALSPAALVRFLHLARSYITSTGEVQISSQIHREQARNVARCRERLRTLVEASLEPPKPRKKTRPSAGARRRRLANKKARADLKRGRSFRPGADD